RACPHEHNDLTNTNLIGRCRQNPSNPLLLRLPFQSSNPHILRPSPHPPSSRRATFPMLLSRRFSSALARSAFLARCPLPPRAPPPPRPLPRRLMSSSSSGWHHSSRLPPPPPPPPPSFSD
uniref:Uncharacterized protein n=1 Tax=Aegilops tauschii subsp. strangulata TaxID=200361 RepID=A0A453I737_AEGTS